MGNPSFCNCVAAKVDHKFDPTTAGQAKAVLSPDRAGISGAPVSPVSGADTSVDGASADYAGSNEASMSCYLPPCCVRLILLPEVVVWDCNLIFRACQLFIIMPLTCPQANSISVPDPDQPRQAAGAFSIFICLPYKIRIQIWQQAMDQNPRLIELEWTDKW